MNASSPALAPERIGRTAAERAGRDAAADFVSLVEQAAPGVLPDVVLVGVLRAHISWATADDEASAVVRAVLDAHAQMIGRPL